MELGAFSISLAVKDLDYPVGWLFKGQYWNHNNMDVVTLFHHAWPQASREQRQAMTAEIEKMLRWCLEESLQGDGSFQPSMGDGSGEEGAYFGASFLVRLGYFGKSQRFWTDRDFPEAEAVRQRIVANIRAHLGSGGAGGTYYENALRQLGEKI